MTRIVLLVAALAATCNPVPPSPPEPGPADAAPTPPADAAACEDDCCRACAVLARFSCPEGLPTAKGETCADVVRRTEATGVVHLPADCVAHAKSLADVIGCGVRCVK